MKTLAVDAVVDFSVSWVSPWQGPAALRASHLHLLTAGELESLRTDLDRGIVPADLETKLRRLAAGDLSHRFIEQNCRTMIALLRAVREGGFSAASERDCDRLLQVLAYVRRDDDAIPDYRPNGYLDDQQELRAALAELSPVLQRFKEWRLRHQVPGLWLSRAGGLSPTT
jgi:hypothetical protein